MTLRVLEVQKVEGNDATLMEEEVFGENVESGSCCAGVLKSFAVAPRTRQVPNTSQINSAVGALAPNTGE